MKDINFGAFESLYDFYTAFPNEETCIAYLEKVLWPNGVVSPYDVNLFSPHTDNLINNLVKEMVGEDK